MTVTSDPIFDVVVVGAGPTGLTLANYLGRAGRSVLLVEANVTTVGEPRAVSIDDESLRVMQELGLLDTVVSATVAGYGTEYWSPSRHMFLKVKPRSQVYGHPKRSAFRQPVFESQLRKGLERYSNVECRFSTRMVKFSQNDAQVVVHLKSRDEASCVVRARYLVGADGGRSTTRQLLGVGMTGGSFDERWLIVDLEGVATDREDTVVYCDPKRPAISLPGPNATRRYEFKLRPEEKDEALLSDECVAALLASHNVPLGGRIVRKVVYRFHALLADRWGAGRVWLAGDAAHLSPPFAGQGMNSGIRDAIALGWRLDAIFSGAFGEGLLKTYQIERESHVGQMIQLAIRVGRIMGPANILSGALTRLFFRSLRIWPQAHSYFAEMRYKPPPRFAKGFFIGSSIKKSAVVGRMLPQPRLAEGPHIGRLLDDVIGSGFVLIGIGISQARLAAVPMGPTWETVIARRMAIPVAWMPELSQFSNKVLLLRPDRYVMACFNAEEAVHIVPRLETLYRSTWPT